MNAVQPHFTHLECTACGRTYPSSAWRGLCDCGRPLAARYDLAAVRKAEPDTLVLADGTSCRHQIKDGSGRDALHVARALAMSLNPSMAGAGI